MTYPRPSRERARDGAFRIIAATLALFAAVCAAVPAFSQSAPRIVAPGNYAPPAAPCVLQNDGSCAYVSASVPLPISGSFSATLSGFAPGGTYATLSASTTSANVALPVGTTVVAFNTGSNTGFLNLGTSAAVAATASQIPVPAGGWIALTPGSNTYVAAITSTGTTAFTFVGGSGLPTGALSGSGGGSSNASVSSTASAVPASATYLGASVSGTLTGLTATANGLKVDGSAVTQPVSGTVTANIGTVATLATAANQTNVQSSAGTSATTLLTIQGHASGVAVPVSAASLPLPAGAATAANQTNVQSSPGSSASTALTIQGSASGVAVPVLNTGAANFTPGQSSISTTASLIANARTGRQSITIVNTGTTPIYLGGSGVTTSTGTLLPGILGASVTLPTTVAIYGIVASGTATVTEYELY